MYYIKNGLSKNWHWLAVLFSVFGVLTVFGTGNATQVNTITTAIDTALLNYHLISPDSVKTVNLILGVVIAIIVGLVLLGGVKRIGKVTEKLVPFMALLYIVLSLGVVLLNIEHVPSVFASIIHGAFNPSAVTGGIVGSFFLSMKKGVSRGIFSNEAGLGTGSIAHACADTQKPVKQGLFGIFGDYTYRYYCDLYTHRSCNSCKRYFYPVRSRCRSRAYHLWLHRRLRKLGIHFHGNCNVLLCFFHNYRLGTLRCRDCVEFLFSVKVIRPFMIVYSLVAILGATMDLGLLWSIAETFNGLMSIPNLIALFLLSGTVIKLVKEYFKE